jgi:NADPH:quinone reductase-like Zn-dependent oxidoreductase
MRAIVYQEYGPPAVLRLAEVAQPVPGDGEVLIRIRAAAVNPLDWHLMRGSPYLVRMAAGLRRPKDGRLGVDAAGRVEAVGAKVTRFRPGDEVFGACKGAFAEYGCAAEGALAPKPASVTFEQAAAVPVAALTALQGLRERGRVRPGQKVLVNGAAGGVGTFAVQVARVLGAGVTGVCSTRNLEMVRSIGADRVVDYTREDFTASGARYDLIFDCVGNHSPSACRRALTSTGTLVLVGGPDEGRWLGPMAGVVRAVVLSMFVRQRLLGFLARVSRNDDLMFVRGLLEAGKVTPVLDRSYPLSRVPEAIAYLQEGHARGKVVITTERRVKA